MPAGKISRQCPECRVKLTRYEWSKLWWMSGLMSGRLVQPCSECGARLRMSSMALVSSAAAIGLIITAILYLVYQENVLLFIALPLLLVILIAMMATRIEAVPSLTARLDPPPERAGRTRP
jgi:hypothetical protein